MSAVELIDSLIDASDDAVAKNGAFSKEELSDTFAQLKQHADAALYLQSPHTRAVNDLLNGGDPDKFMEHLDSVLRVSPEIDNAQADNRVTLNPNANANANAKAQPQTASIMGNMPAAQPSVTDPQLMTKQAHAQGFGFENVFPKSNRDSENDGESLNQ